MTIKSFNQANQKFYKRNFCDVVDFLIPKYYILEDRNQFTDKLDVFDSVVNSQIKLANDLKNLLELPEGNVFNDLSSLVGIFPLFDKKNKFSFIDPFKFEKLVLFPLNYSFKDFSSSSQFVDFLETKLIPDLNNTRSSKESVDYYINNLGWFYLLATSSTTQSVQPSSFVAPYVVTKLFNQEQELTLADGINALTDYVWYNSLNYLPEEFQPGVSEYTSGVQQLAKLHTVNSILYSDEYLDRYDTFVEDAFSYFDQTGEYLEEVSNNGAFWRLIKAFSFSFADRQNEVNKLNSLYDLQDCPDEYLPELANLIGWKLLGYDRNKWRLQLANAIDVYRRAGTKQSIQVALDNLFGFGGINLENSNIKELWESYIPYLILYALSTESPYFVNYTTFTRDLADSLGIDNYDIRHFDNNIRAAVDKILLILFEEFPDHFKLAGVPFPQNTNSFTFNYRGKTYPIPPFEEIPYYLTCEVTPKFLEVLNELLLCFGVNKAFADALTDYIKVNTYADLSDIAVNNSWLIFTESMELPPNWEDPFPEDLNGKFPKPYQPEFKTRTSFRNNSPANLSQMWSGKSSHFQLDLSATNFNFEKTLFTPDSKYALLTTSRIIQEFSPANAIPVINVHVDSLTDNYDYTLENLLTEIERNPQEYPEFTNNYQNLAVNFLNGFEQFSGLGRQRASTLFAPTGGPRFNTTEAELTDIPRITARRRNFKNALNFDYFFDRTGLNPPAPRVGDPGLNPVEDSKLVPKGFIPSSMQFVDFSGTCSGLLSSMPGPFRACPSSKFFYGYYLSSTINYRGPTEYPLNELGSYAFEDRGQLDPFLYLIYRIEQRKLEEEVYQDIINNRQNYYNETNYWLNVEKSEVNKKLSCNQSFLSSVDNYLNYTFGKKVHKLYHSYTSAFNYHPLTNVKTSENPADILRHCFGSILNNSDFDIRSTYGNNFYTSAASNIKILNLTSLPFNSETYDSYGTIAATSSDSVIAKRSTGASTKELINSTIIDGVDLIQTSGASLDNEFIIYDLLNYNEDSYINNNCFIKLRSINGLPRLRFQISGTDLSETWGSFRSNGFLTPNHKFNFTVKGLAALNDGSVLSDAEIGIWIHTKETPSGQSYHYNKNGEWVSLSRNNVTIPTILNELCHRSSFNPERGITRSDPIDTRVLRCLNQDIDVDSDDPIVSESISLFKNEYFSEVNVEFDTAFGCLSNNSLDIHGYDQHYIVEVFMIPDRRNTERFMLIDEVSLVDETLRDYTRLQSGGDSIGPLGLNFCNPSYMDLSENDIRIILQTFSRFAGRNSTIGFLSRNNQGQITEHLNEGGSRLSYRDSLNMYNTSPALIVNGDNGQILVLDLMNPTAETLLARTYAPNTEVAEAIATAPVEGEDVFENVRFGFWL